MTPLRFPLSRIVPEPDLTELAVQRVMEVARDLEQAIAEARTLDRAFQLVDQAQICCQWLNDVEKAARHKMDILED